MGNILAFQLACKWKGREGEGREGKEELAVIKSNPHLAFGMCVKDTERDGKPELKTKQV